MSNNMNQIQEKWVENWKNQANYLSENGLYVPQLETSACGVGLIAAIDGKSSRKLVQRALDSLKALWHRGAVDADGKTGDGAGIHVQIPQEFFKNHIERTGHQVGKGRLAIGMVFLAAKPWAPGLITICSTIYQRVNMFASGKMFVANSLPGFMIAMFDWNPLFHTIDQTRGFVFINYNPHNSSVSYPLYLAGALVVIGLMGEFFTRKRASASWGAAR